MRIIRFPIIFVALSISFSLVRADAFAEKMSHYYGKDLSYQMYYFSTGWWGATVWEPGGCTDTVYLSDQFYGDLGEDELWKGVLAHEWAHVLQGSTCVNNERNANKIAVQKLKDANEWRAVFLWCEYITEVERMDIEECKITN
jgi:hypothetical protein